ncbi:MAG: HAD-IB family phosphatase [Planctomycetota bacterium]|nr:HAD-IB family phosphatase [Verrucomicrobiota bacterium]MDI9442969.1 HAD-IB family phosphatase [Planctomycetota bacterium]
MSKEPSFFCFDFDGTVSSAEALPRLAKEAGIEEEMATLTDITMKGILPFPQSFRLRVKLLSTLPLARAQAVMDQVPIAPDIAGFIREHRERCVIITGNLDVYMAPIVAKLPCRFFTSVAQVAGGQVTGIDTLLDKGDTVRMLRDREGHRRLVAVGDGANDIPMFEAADVVVSYFGVTRANELLYPFSHYVVFKEKSLCQLLKTL